ncbi:biotin--[acetyl-CoA-carboxylase] ligase [Devosia sp.]|uniref:biotin--[acetyl-CoA-carboxylase] ligase n=1 Tax=Devosia sp. TaxID=1871048 RepID=UPI002F0C3887
MSEFWLGERAGIRGYRLVGYDTVGSTNAEALRAAASGDVGDVWFAALGQTQGRGRRGRSWDTTHGNLAASLLVLPDADPAVAATLGFVAGVALERALATLLPRGAAEADRRIALKWPNDVLAGGAKLAGILLEAERRRDGRVAIVVGFGVNVVAAPAGLPYPATSLRALGIEVPAGAVLAALADAWVDCYDAWDNGRGVADILRQWRAAAAGVGAPVAVDRGGDIVRGIFDSIDEAGRLIVHADDGRRIVVTAGDVHFGATA